MSGRLALVLPGGGARAAYQVGVLRHLARLRPDLRIAIYTGTSAGAINAVHLAAHPGSFESAVVRLVELWRAIDTPHVFRVGALDLAGKVLRWACRLVSGGAPITPPTRGLVDTTPLRRFLEEALETRGGPIPGLRRNIEAGRIEAIGVTTTDYGDGRSVTWCQGRDPSRWTRPHRRGVASDITLDHVLASAALPLFFPAVRLADSWHGDGDIRLTAPLSPALHLGADRILAIAPRRLRPHDEPRARLAGYPPPAQILGVLLNAVFLDNLDFDAQQMERLNRLIDVLGERAPEDVRRVRLGVFRPSADLGRLAASYEPELPAAFRFLIRGLGTRQAQSADALSVILFQHRYIAELLALGEADARHRERELLAIVEDAEA